MKPTVILLLFFSFILPTAAQQKEYIFKNFTQEEGLPSNEAYYVFEDSRHFLWFATDLGVVRYNGSKFEQFNLPDNVVFKIREDSKGRIWFFSHKAQLAYFESEKIHIYKHNDKIAKKIPKINIVDSYVSEKETIYLSSSTEYDYIIDSLGGIQEYDHSSLLGKSAIFSIEVNKVRNQTSCYTSVLQRDYSQSGKITLLLKENYKQYSIELLLKNSPVTNSHYGCIFFDNFYYFFAGKFIIKFSKGGLIKTLELSNDILSIVPDEGSIRVSMLKGGSRLISKGLELLGNEIFIGKSVTSFCIDHEGGKWFSTLESGLYYIKNTKITHFHIAKEVNLNIFRISNLNDNSILFSTADGIYQYDLKGIQLVFPCQNYSISDIYQDSNNNIFLSGAVLNTYYNVEKIKFKNINKVNVIRGTSELIFLDSFLIHSHAEKVIKLRLLPTLKNDILHSSEFEILINHQLKLFKDHDNFIWGGDQVGLYKYSKLADTFFQVRTDLPLLKKGVTCIRQMDSGLIVTGIRFGGIAVFKDTNLISNITEKDGLLSDKVRYLLPIKDQLWVATAMGISVIKFTSYNPLKYSIINIGKNDGFYNVTINQLIQFKGDIVAATSNGLYFIKDPDELINRKPIPIPFYINSVSYYKNDTSAVNSLDLPYSKSRVLLRYSAACFNSAEEVKYQYTFSSADTGWITTTSTELLLENLEPGDYDFRIKAVIPNQNRTSEVQHFHITVQKPWWQNNWFRAAVIMSFIGAGIAFSRYRIKKVQADEERKTALNAKIAELEQTALRAQMNPHFIFNCLTSIQQLIVTGDKTEANEYLVKFARLIRKTLDLSANPFISIKDEMEYLAEYMFLEQLRITGRFEYFIDADKTIDKERILIPNMMIQPVVENCIRHGIKSLEQRKGIINVHFKMNEGQLTCTVKDNGIGRKNSANESTDLIKHKSYGIDIIEKRLKVFEELNNEQMGLEIKDLFNDDATPAGTEVILQLPYKITV